MWVSVLQIKIVFLNRALPVAEVWANSFLIGRVLYGFISIFLLIQSLLMSSSAANGHLLMVAAIRGSRAAVRALERRVAEPHSMAFSCRKHSYLGCIWSCAGYALNINRVNVLLFYLRTTEADAYRCKLLVEQLRSWPLLWSIMISLTKEATEIWEHSSITTVKSRVVSLTTVQQNELNRFISR